MCHYAYFHDHNSELFITQLPRQSVRSRKLKNRKFKIHSQYCEVPQLFDFFVV